MDQNLARLHEIITKATSGVVVLPAHPSPDAIAAATALYLSLEKMGKNVSIVCQDEIESDCTASDKIQPNLVTGGDNLVVSFPYSDGAIDKVDYNIQGENFNLIVTPRPGFQKLNPEKVKFNYTGGNLDFIAIIDAPALNGLGSVYSDNQNQFQGRDIINIDRHLTNGFYGTLNYVNKTVSSISELVLTVIKALKIEIDKDIATNLYSGIATATNNFTSYSVTADTFEHVAELLRMGAVKKPAHRQAFSEPVNPFEPQISTMFRHPKPFDKQRNMPARRINPEVPNEKPIEEVEKEVRPEDPKQNPQDWLKPKIFKGGNLI